MSGWDEPEDGTTVAVDVANEDGYAVFTRDDRTPGGLGRVFARNVTGARWWPEGDRTPWTWGEVEALGEPFIYQPS